MCPDLPMECFRIKVACVRTFWSPWTTERLNHSAGARRRHIPPHQPKAEFGQQPGWRSARLDRPGVDLCGARCEAWPERSVPDAFDARRVRADDEVEVGGFVKPSFFSPWMRCDRSRTRGVT